MKKTVLALAIAAAAGFAGAANAAPVATTAVFDMNSFLGYDNSPGTAVTPGSVGHDTTVTGFIDTAAGTWGVASTTPFFGAVWTASNGQLIQTAGTYALNTTTGVVSASGPCGTAANNGSMCFDVGAGQVAGTIDFAWGVNSGIRVVNVWSVSGGNYTPVSVPGMENGPFQGFNATFTLHAVPVPAAVWLLGSGLVGLVGVARRRKNVV